MDYEKLSPGLQAELKLTPEQTAMLQHWYQEMKRQMRTALSYDEFVGTLLGGERPVIPQLPALDAWAARRGFVPVGRPRGFRGKGKGRRRR